MLLISPMSVTYPAYIITIIIFAELKLVLLFIYTEQFDSTVRARWNFVWRTSNVGGSKQDEKLNYFKTITALSKAVNWWNVSHRVALSVKQRLATLPRGRVHWPSGTFSLFYRLPNDAHSKLSYFSLMWSAACWRAINQVR